MARLFRPFKWVFQSLWRLINFVRLLLSNLLFLLVVLILLFFLYKEEPVSMTPQGALELNLSGKLVEQTTTPQPGSLWLDQWLSGDEAEREMVVADVVYGIHQAKADPNIKGMVLRLQDLQPAPLDKLRTIGAAIDDFRASGKPVVAVGDFFDQYQYLLAAHADSILLNPAGAVVIQGLELYNFYFKSALDKLDITPHVFRVGRYKSFVEPYTRDDMSPEAREANRHWLSQLWQRYVQDVVAARKLSADVVSPTKEQLIARLTQVNGNAADYALKQGLVDQLATRDEMRSTIASFAGKAEDDRDYRHVTLRQYLRSRPPQYPTQPDAPPQIGLIVAEGTIMNGKQPAGRIGGESLSALLADAADDDKIKAVVLRIDSPGGSAFAAEQIRTQLLALKQAGKPVVISMGSMAASGGYWIAANGDKILAEETTLTGSIGVFGLFATLDKALMHAGVHTDGIGTTDFTGLSPTRELPEHVKAIVQMNVENTYQRFISLVAEGRGMTPDQVDNIAQGRVWTGRDAKELGLVDELGGVPEAILAAAKLADLDNFGVQPVEPPLSPRDRLLQQLFDQASQVRLPGWLQNLTRLAQFSGEQLSPLSEFDDPLGNYALCQINFR